ncbi:hypothetical protein [Nocardioides sp. 1609]|uniref:hypothetical protein n=1 Tax=Nocardioides sp. 1609 TaxID=2508327 RepID=UPI00106F4BDE|nr:hypothetical protein [Nocardioides sp. 1609]
MTTSGLRLDRVDDRTDAVEAVVARSGGRVPLDALLDDLPRRLRTTRAPGRAVHEAFRYDARDQLDLRWWPQGVTTNADAGTHRGRRLAMTTWYAKKLPHEDAGQGSRLTVMDLDRGRYRHVLLVRPRDDGTVEPLHVHAGGVVWQGSRIHVAGTGRGLFTCLLDDLVRVPDRAAAHGYRYVLPVRWQYRAHADEGVEKFRFSFLSLDQTGRGGPAGPDLLAGEYTDDPARTRRLARLCLGDGAVDRAAIEPFGSGPRRMQGVAAGRDHVYVTVSQGRFVRGSVFSGPAGDPSLLREHRHATPMGNEDVAYSPDEDLLYSVSEHPSVRWLFTMRRSWFD